MDCLELLRKHLSMCGIKVSHKSPKNHPVNKRNLTVFILACFCDTMAVISLKDANTFDEFTDILFRSISMGTFDILYVIIICKTSKLFEFFDSLVDIVEARE